MQEECREQWASLIVIERLVMFCNFFVQCTGVENLSKINFLCEKMSLCLLCIRELNLNKCFFYFCIADIENESTSVGASTISVTRSEG